MCRNHYYYYHLHHHIILFFTCSFSVLFNHHRHQSSIISHQPAIINSLFSIIYNLSSIIYYMSFDSFVYHLSIIVVIIRCRKHVRWFALHVGTPPPRRCAALKSLAMQLWIFCTGAKSRAVAATKSSRMCILSTMCKYRWLYSHI